MPIIIKRGLKANLPVLQIGELALCTDTLEVFIGTPSGNKIIGGSNASVSNNSSSIKVTAEEPFSGSNNITKTFSKDMIGFVISNDGTSDLSFTINNQTFVVKSFEVFDSFFSPFKTVSIVTTSPYRAYGQATLELTSTPPVDTTAPTITISPNSGTFNSSQQITLTSNEQAIIYYTLDGSTPTVSSSVYSTPITISTTTTIKYFAKDASGNTSTVQSATYSIDTIAPTVTVSPNGGTYSSAQTVTLSTNETSTIYYTLDGSTPTTSSLFYSTPLNLPNSATLKFFAKDVAGNSSSIQSAVFTINVPDTTPPTVNASPFGGTYTSTQNITLTANETATIYFTTDGSTPTATSPVYASPIAISSNATLKYFAKDTAGNSSTIQTQSYTINIPDTTPPNNVTNLVTSNMTQTGVTLTWTASNSTDVASYDIYNGMTFITNVTGTTYNVTGLSASTQYTFNVKAKDVSGNVASGTSVTVTTSAPADTTPPTVTASPVAGTYTSTQSVTLSANETATIYYTTDGTTPTEASTVYSSPISISASTTLKFFGKDTAGNSSTVQTQIYTIDTSLSYVTSGLTHYANSPTNGTTIPNPDNYFQGNTLWTMAITIKPVLSGANAANSLVTRLAPNAIKFEFTYDYKFDAILTGKNGSGSAQYPQPTPNPVFSDLTKYYHVVLERTATALTIYVDDVQVSTVAVSSDFTIDSSTSPLVIGGTGRPGLFKNVAFYNRVLSTSEKTQNYNALK